MNKPLSPKGKLLQSISQPLYSLHLEVLVPVPPTYQSRATTIQTVLSTSLLHLTFPRSPQGLPESPSHIPLGIVAGLTTRHALALAPVRVPGLVKGEGDMDPSYRFQGRKMHELTEADHTQLRAARTIGIRASLIRGHCGG